MTEINTLASAAEDLVLADFSILPVKDNKRPQLTTWTHLQKEIIPYDDVQSYFKTAWGIGVICGEISGGLECIDFDSHDKNIHEVFKKWASNTDVQDIIIRNKLYVEKSQSGGYHILYRYDDEGQRQGNLKLAAWSNGESMIETRGEGGYVIVAPTPGYSLLRNSIIELRQITYDERQYLIEYCRSFNMVQSTKQPVEETKKGDAFGEHYHHTDPVSFFNWHKAAYAKNLLKKCRWTYVDFEKTKQVERWRRPGKNDGISATWGKKEDSFYVFTSSAPPFEQNKYYTPFQILVLLRFEGNHYAATEWIMRFYFGDAVPYIRVGVDYFKKIKKTDRYGMERIELKKWTKDEIKQDHGKNIFNDLPLYDDFTIRPSNKEYHAVIENCYNLYSPFPHEPIPGETYWSELLMRHIFGDQYDMGLRYLQALYLHPERMLPILVLVSKERQTGKTTFINWLNMIFGGNMVNIAPEDLVGAFNHVYATSNIIAVEETLIEKSITVEKLKALATGKFLTVNQKYVSHYKVPFYGKIILASNNEDKFARIDEEEIRFFIRKVGKPTTSNHNIEEDLQREIPAFLHFLTTLPAIDWSRDRSGFTPDEIANENLHKVKKESKSGLFKELVELFTDLFDNHPEAIEDFKCTPVDVKERFFKTNSKVDSQYIRYVMKNEFKKTPSDRVIRYTPFGSADNMLQTKTGTPFTFNREEFTVKNEGLPF